MSGKKNRKTRLADDNNHRFIRTISARPVLSDRGNVLAPRRWMKLKDGYTCLVATYNVWASTGYGALSTKVLDKWHIKSVLRRTGVRC